MNDPELANAVLLDSRAFQKTSATLRYRYAVGDGTATTGFVADGSAAYAPARTLDEFRRTKRRLISPAFHQRWFEAYAAATERVAGAMCAELRAGTADLLPFVSEFTMRALVECLFGAPATDATLELQRAVSGSAIFLDHHLRSGARLLGNVLDRGNRTRPPGDWLPGRRRSALRARSLALHRAVGELLDRQGPAGLPDLVSLLRSGHHAGTDQPLTRQQLVHAITGLLLAGFESSAICGAWTLWLLATHPDVQDAIAAEVLAGSSHRPSPSPPSPSPLLQACFKESLRLYPPVWSLARETRQDTTVGEYRFRSGTVLIVSPWLMQRRGDAWPDPERFDPGRFVGAARPRPGTYFPFGVGQRECIGKHFAVLELSAIVSALLRTWRLVPSPEHAPPRPWLTVTQRPAPHVMVRLVPRRGIGAAAAGSAEDGSVATPVLSPSSTGAGATGR